MKDHIFPNPREIAGTLAISPFFHELIQNASELLIVAPSLGDRGLKFLQQAVEGNSISKVEVLVPLVAGGITQEEHLIALDLLVKSNPPAKEPSGSYG
jgi:hypothetical protein